MFSNLIKPEYTVPAVIAPSPPATLKPTSVAPCPAASSMTMSSPVRFSSVIVPLLFKVAVTPVACLLMLSTKLEALVAISIAAPLIENESDILNSDLKPEVNWLNAVAVTP